MDISVVVPTLNGRERLRGCLDALADHAPAAEVVVVNGPSTDGTTGMVTGRSVVDTLLEVPERTPNVARNAGIAAATGDAVALVAHDRRVEASWLDAVRAGLAEADVVTGPTRRSVRAGVTTEGHRSEAVAGTDIDLLNAENVAFDREAIEAVDGFDERLPTGGVRDCAHRLAALDRSVAWRPEACVRDEFGADGGRVRHDWNARYHSRTYRLVKTHGLRPRVLARIVGTGVREAGNGVRSVATGDSEPSSWLRGSRAATSGTVSGLLAGFKARLSDRSAVHNPAGLSSRGDRVVRREEL
ncbi:glycosyl transferase family 2 [Halobacteriales archaeon SW_7_68_16]|nr:MAG: glycosyl transferase family 2 [Halobacteriales archaeon SW_7_68_16]